tara:strand:- start:271 stop:420 length:150 start_codon:yes stop_codon:yes gene_type:complete
MEKLGKTPIKRLGRELKIKGIVTFFHGRIHSLPLTKGLAGVCIRGTAWY